MNKTLKNIIKNTIDREYSRVMDDYSDNLKKSPELVGFEAECTEKLNNSIHELFKLLPKEHHHLVNELEDAATALMSIESKIAFKEGLVLGVTELSYLSEVGAAITVI